MKCKNCGTQNSDQALKCINCNAPLDGSMVAEKKTSAKKASGSVVCKNCKTANPADALKCTNCNAPLEGSMVASVSQAELSVGQVMCKNCKAINPADALKCHQCNAPLDGSLVVRNETPAAARPSGKPGSKVDKDTTAFHFQQSNQIICPNCSYPNQAIAIECIRCHTPLKSGDSKSKAPAPAVKKPDKSAEPAGTGKEKTSPKINLTVNPWAEQPVKPDNYCLTPLKSDYSVSGESFPLENAENNLNRDNLDPDNKTITSSSQAVIRFKDGKWTISDTSTMKTTFIKVQGEVELSDGDILLLGNKIFKFSRQE